MDGRVWLVPGTVPGDRVRAQLLKDHGRWVAARAIGLVTPSPRRREPPCPYQPECGGCPLMATGEEEQRAAKRRFVVDAVERIGKLPGVEVSACVPSPSALSYRNKVELSFAPQGGAVGYHASDDPSRVIDVASCAIADPRLEPPLAVVRAALRAGTLRPRPGRLVLRASGSAPDVLVAFRDQGEPFEEAPTIAHALAASVPGLCGVVRLIGSAGRRGGARIETIHGRPWVEETVLGHTFRVPAGTFLQVNPAAAAALGRHVLEGAGDPSRVTEVYGGIGALGIALAVRGAAVSIVDADADAVACGEDAAARAGVRARFVRSDVLRFLRGDRAGADLVVADPPRTGLGPGVAEALAARAPRLALVSCDPATLARDLARLVASGMDVERITPFDLFPQTAHVEAVAWLTRRASSRRPQRGGSPRRASGSR